MIKILLMKLSTEKLACSLVQKPVLWRPSEDVRYHQPKLADRQSADVPCKFPDWI